MAKKLVNKPVVTTMTEQHKVFINAGENVRQITLEDFRKALNIDDMEVLNDLAFYLDVNEPSTLGSTRVDRGGNMHMEALWVNQGVSVIMDANGNYCELNRNDSNYVVEGEKVTNSDGTVASAYAHGDFMKILPETYGRVQLIEVNNTVKPRLWLSLLPLPGGFVIPRQVVGKNKCSLVNGKLRSLPGMTVEGNHTIKAFWDYAQARSLNHGLANGDYYNFLAFYVMAHYGYRDVQNCQSSDGTLVFGCGLDGSENTSGSSEDGFTRQKTIKTGTTMTLGDGDGKVAVTDHAGGTCHSVCIDGFDNPFAQYWEMMQGYCSIGTKVMCWRHNWMPSGSQPVEADFNNVEHVELTRSTRPSNTAPLPTGMNIISSQEGQGVYMIPKEPVTGVSYGDGWWYDASGQLWLFGGYSNYGALCGVACAASDVVWASSLAYRSARLAYYGPVRKVTAAEFKALAA